MDDDTNSAYRWGWGVQNPEQIVYVLYGWSQYIRFCVADALMYKCMSIRETILGEFKWQGYGDKFSGDDFQLLEGLVGLNSIKKRNISLIKQLI